MNWLFQPLNGHPDDAETWQFQLILASVIALIIVPIFAKSVSSLRKSHPQYIFALWYTYSLSLCVFYIIFRFVDAHKDYYGSFKTIVVPFLRTSDELQFLFTIITVGIIPQCLSYFLCGVFGNARQPFWISGLTKFIILSYAKYLCMMSASLLIFPFIFDLNDEFDIQSFASLFLFFRSATIMSFAFAVVALYYKYEEFSHLTEPLYFLSPIDDFLTRNITDKSKDVSDIHS